MPLKQEHHIVKVRTSTWTEFRIQRWRDLIRVPEVSRAAKLRKHARTFLRTWILCTCATTAAKPQRWLRLCSRQKLTEIFCKVVKFAPTQDYEINAADVHFTDAVTQPSLKCLIRPTVERQCYITWRSTDTRPNLQHNTSHSEVFLSLHRSVQGHCLSVRLKALQLWLYAPAYNSG